MKLSPQIIIGLVLVFLGIVFVIAGALIKINGISDGWLSGNNLIILGMAIELIGIFFAANQITKKMKK